MVLVGNGRYLAYERSRSLLNISSKVTQDSAFPFQPGDQLRVTIDPKRKCLIIEHAPPAKEDRKEKKRK